MTTTGARLHRGANNRCAVTDFQEMLTRLWRTCAEWVSPFVVGTLIKFSAIMLSKSLPSIRVLFTNSLFGGLACVVAYYWAVEQNLPIWARLLLMCSASIVGYPLFTKVHKRLECKLDEGLDKLFPLKKSESEKSKDNHHD